MRATGEWSIRNGRSRPAQIRRKRKLKKKKRNEKEETRQRKCYTYDFLGSCLDPYDYKLFSSVKGMISGFFVYGSTLGIGVIEIIRFLTKIRKEKRGNSSPWRGPPVCFAHLRLWPSPFPSGFRPLLLWLYRSYFRSDPVQICGSDQEL